MKIDPNGPAFPCLPDDLTDLPAYIDAKATGLTVRAYVATQLAAALLQRGYTTSLDSAKAKDLRHYRENEDDDLTGLTGLASDACDVTDALIAELNKE